MKRNFILIFAATILLNISSLAQMSGVYSVGTGNVSGENGHYATLKDAVTALNAATFNGDVSIIITSSTTENCSVSGIGLAIDPNPYYVTFKPATGVTPITTLDYPTDANSGPSGAFVIGVPHINKIAWADIKATKNLIFDGSNTVDGTTRDWTIQSSTSSQRNAFPMVLVGNISKTVIKNMKIYQQANGTSTSKKFNGTIQIRTRDNLFASNITIHNNHISTNFAGVPAGNGGITVYRSGTNTDVDMPENITITNNLIEGKSQAICLNFTGTFNVSNNELIVNQDIDGTFSSEAIFVANSKASSNFIFNANKFSKIESLLSATSYLRAFTMETPTNAVVSNNMFYGFKTLSSATGQSGEIIGAFFSASNSNVVYAFNSMYMSDLSDNASSQIVYKGLKLTAGNLVAKNNIFVGAEVDFANEFMNIGVVTAELNNNIYYNSGSSNVKVGTLLTNQATDLASWQTITTQEANSLASDPKFTSQTDLHVLKASPAESAGVTLLNILTDFDGETRNATTPDIGADEFTGTSSYFSNIQTLDAKIWTNQNEVFIQSPFDGKVQIFNMLGAVIAEENILSNSIHNISINGAKGVYLIKVKAENAVKTQKVIIK